MDFSEPSPMRASCSQQGCLFCFSLTLSVGPGACSRLLIPLHQEPTGQKNLQGHEWVGRAWRPRTSLSHLGKAAGKPQQGVVRDRFLTDTPCIQTTALVDDLLSPGKRAMQVTCSPLRPGLSARASRSDGGMKLLGCCCAVAGLTLPATVCSRSQHAIQLRAGVQPAFSTSLWVLRAPSLTSLVQSFQTQEACMERSAAQLQALRYETGRR